jgi:hypothetical protein
MATSQACCHLPSKILNSAAKCADRARIQTLSARNVPEIFHLAQITYISKVFLNVARFNSVGKNVSWSMTKLSQRRWWLISGDKYESLLWWWMMQAAQFSSDAVCFNQQFHAGNHWRVRRCAIFWVVRVAKFSLHFNIILICPLLIN